jgi:DNA-binding transcriptional ArsR family regulator
MSRQALALRRRRTARGPDDPTLDAVFSALSDGTRRRILARLAAGPVTIGELAAPLPMSLPAVSKHIRVLERAGLLRRARDGWYHQCRLDGGALQTASAFLERYRPFWEQTLAQLADYVERRPGKRAARSRRR